MDRGTGGTGRFACRRQFERCVGRPAVRGSLRAGRSPTARRSFGEWYALHELALQFVPAKRPFDARSEHIVALRWSGYFDFSNARRNFAERARPFTGRATARNQCDCPESHSRLEMLSQVRRELAVEAKKSE